MAAKCQRCGRGFADLDYLTGKPTIKCSCGTKRPAETEEDHGYTTRIGLAMSQEPEAIPSSLQEEYSKEARERESDAQEEKRLSALRDVLENEVCAKDARTKKRYRAARKQLEDALQPSVQPV